MICFRFLLLLLHRPKALFEKSKFEKCNEVSKLANRNPLEHKIKLSYNISEHYLVQKSFEVEQYSESASAHTLHFFLVAKLVHVESEGCKQIAAHRRNRIRASFFLAIHVHEKGIILKFAF